MFKFTIRELLLVTMIAAIGVSWGLRERQLWADYADQKEESRLWRVRCERLADRYASAGGMVKWDDHSITTLLLGSYTTITTDGD